PQTQKVIQRSLPAGKLAALMGGAQRFDPPFGHVALTLLELFLGDLGAGAPGLNSANYLPSTSATLHPHSGVEESIEEGRPRAPYFSFVPRRRRWHLPPGASPTPFDQIPVPVRVPPRADPECLNQPFPILVVDADERVGALHCKQS